jgi:hypothetical protein
MFLIAAGSLLAVVSGGPSIGFVKSAGEFRVDGSAIRGNGTVFEGALVETTTARSVIQLAAPRLPLRRIRGFACTATAPYWRRVPSP